MATALDPASSATRAWSARKAETCSSPEPGEATRCWATEPACSPPAQSSRAARAWSSPTATSGQPGLDRPPDQGMDELDGVPVADDAGRLESCRPGRPPRRSRARTARRPRRGSSRRRGRRPPGPAPWPHHPARPAERRRSVAARGCSGTASQAALPARIRLVLAHQLVQVERVATRDAQALIDETVVERVTQLVGDQCRDRVASERPRHEHRAVRMRTDRRQQRLDRGVLDRSAGQHEHHRLGRELGLDVEQHPQGRGVGPVGIVHRQHERRLLGEPGDQPLTAVVDTL